MGRCYEFGTSIAEGCDHAMVVTSSGGACVCVRCQTLCGGRFGGCAAVIAEPGRIPAYAPAWALDPEASPPAPVAIGRARDRIDVVPPTPVASNGVAPAYLNGQAAPSAPPAAERDLSLLMAAIDRFARDIASVRAHLDGFDASVHAKLEALDTSVHGRLDSLDEAITRIAADKPKRLSLLSRDAGAPNADELSDTVHELQSHVDLVADRLSTLLGGPSLTELMDRFDEIDRRILLLGEQLEATTAPPPTRKTAARKKVAAPEPEPEAPKARTRTRRKAPEDAPDIAL